MKNYVYLSIMIAFVFIVYGCAENQTRIGEGAGIGGVLGAAAGGIIGHQTHSGVAGALIGGAAGAATGALVGSQIPKPAAHTPAPFNPASQVTMQQIVDWTKESLPSDEIIHRIATTHSSYALTADDISYLRKEGVSQRVIEVMSTRS